jgi:hypothetical protein
MKIKNLPIVKPSVFNRIVVRPCAHAPRHAKKVGSSLPRGMDLEPGHVTIRLRREGMLFNRLRALNFAKDQPLQLM